MSADLLPLRLARLERAATAVGLGALLLTLLGALLDPTPFFRAYLTAYLLPLGVALGALSLLLLHHLTGGGWGWAIRPLLVAGCRTLPFLALLFLPLLLGLPRLYQWARPEVVAADPLLQLKSPYLNVPFFIARAALYFALWIGLSRRLVRGMEGSDGRPPRAYLEAVSGPGLVGHGFALTFAATDWVMSIEAHWSSTIFGLIFIVGSALSALAFVLALAAWAGSAGRGAEAAAPISPHHAHDLGNLLLTLVMLWAYVNFSQFLIIWSGNLSEEIPHYLRRLAPGWHALAALLIVAHFFIPFGLLLGRRNKQRLRTLGSIALGLLALRYLHLVWMVAPAYHPERLRLHWLDAAAPLALSGLWLSAYLRILRTRPLFPPPGSDPETWAMTAGRAQAAEVS